MGARPTHPVTATDMLLDCLLDELQTQTVTLQQILDRLPAPDQGAGSPAPAEPQTDEPAVEPVHIAEPVPEGIGTLAEPATSGDDYIPAPPKSRTPAKKAAKAARRSS